MPGLKIITWNVNGQDISCLDNLNLCDEIPSVICLQEFRSLLLPKDLKVKIESIVRASIKNKQENSENETNPMTKCSSTPNRTKKLKLFVSVVQHCSLLTIFINCSAKSSTFLSLPPSFINKGASFHKLKISDHIVHIVNLHLMAHEENHEKRLKQLKQIIKCDLGNHFFLAGDFNTRVTSRYDTFRSSKKEFTFSYRKPNRIRSISQYISTFIEILKRIFKYFFKKPKIFSKGNYSLLNLLYNGSIDHQMAKMKSKYHLSEGIIRFAPTYKICGTDYCNDKPSWTDRILFFSQNCDYSEYKSSQNEKYEQKKYIKKTLSIKCVEYNALDARKSDHRPVYASFSVKNCTDIASDSDKFVVEPQKHKIISKRVQIRLFLSYILMISHRYALLILIAVFSIVFVRVV